GGYGAQIFVQAHDAGGVHRGILQNLVGRDAGLDVEFKFAVQGESGHGVGAGFDGNSGAIEKAGKIQHFGERLSVGFVHTGWRSQAAREQAAANLIGQAAGDGLEAAGNLSSAAQVHVFEDTEREIELGVVILKQLDEGVHLGRGEVEVGSELGRRGETDGCIRVFDVGEEIQHEEVDVLNFVVAELDTLGGGHFCGDVSADAETVFVGFISDGGYEFGLDRAVDLICT